MPRPIGPFWHFTGLGKHEQDAVEQFDSLIQSAEIESMDDKERIAQLEQQAVDNATAIAALYEAQLTTASANDAGAKEQA